MVPAGYWIDNRTGGTAPDPTLPRPRLDRRAQSGNTERMRTRWLGPGLFLATLSTLLLETLDARLLSVLTWYHLSFFAVSTAMLGMAAGAVYVFLRPERFSRERAPAELAKATFAFAC